MNLGPSFITAGRRRPRRLHAQASGALWEPGHAKVAHSQKPPKEAQRF